MTVCPPSLVDRLVFGGGLVLLLGTALALRIIDLGNLPGINGDEAYYGDLVLDLKAGRGRDLQTGSGLILNPFYSGALLPLHVLRPAPSFVTLRLPALLSGLLALALAYPLLARVFARRVALVTTLLLACLPAAIAYSRFGWDQSQAPLAGLVSLYFALRRRPFAALCAFLAALVVHPLNFFLAPVLLGPAAAEGVRRWCAASPEERRALRRRLPLGGGARLLALAAVALAAGSAVVFSRVPSLAAELPRRLADPAGWFAFAVRWGELLSGATVYRYIAGPVPEAAVGVEHGVFWGLLLLLLAAGLPGLVRRRDTAALGVLGGLAVSLLAFYLVGGVRAISPGQERYAMYLVTPCCLALALLLCATGDTAWARRGQVGCALLVGGLLLAGFAEHYLGALRRTGSEAHRTFRTGPVEPKQAALEHVFAAAGGEPVTVLAEDWWCYYPLRYLGAARPQTRVLPWQEADRAPPSHRFVVGFAGGPCERWLAANAPGLPGREFPDYAGRPVLAVWDLGSADDLLPGLAAAARQAPDRPRVAD
jgi:hypothetical protein